MADDGAVDVSPRSRGVDRNCLGNTVKYIARAVSPRSRGVDRNFKHLGGPLGELGLPSLEGSG